MSDTCTQGHTNIVDSKGRKRCRECTRAWNRASKQRQRARKLADRVALPVVETNPAPSVRTDPGPVIRQRPRTQPTAGYVLVDHDGNPVRTYRRLTDFTDAYSTPVGPADGDLPRARIYGGPPARWTLQRITKSVVV